MRRAAIGETAHLEYAIGETAAAGIPAGVQRAAAGQRRSSSASPAARIAASGTRPEAGHQLELASRLVQQQLEPAADHGGPGGCRGPGERGRPRGVHHVEHRPRGLRRRPGPFGKKISGTGRDGRDGAGPGPRAWPPRPAAAAPPGTPSRCATGPAHGRPDLVADRDRRGAQAGLAQRGQRRAGGRASAEDHRGARRGHASAGQRGHHPGHVGVVAAAPPGGEHHRVGAARVGREQLQRIGLPAAAARRA